MKIGVLKVKEAISRSNAAEQLRRNKATQQQELDALIEEFDAVDGPRKLGGLVRHHYKDHSAPGRRPINVDVTNRIWINERRFYGLDVKLQKSACDSYKGEPSPLDLLYKSRAIVRLSIQLEDDF